MLTLSNENARVVIASGAGGRIASLRVFGLELLVPACDDPLGWGAYPMAPWVGRTRNGMFRFNGMEHSLPLTLPPHAIHGTVWNRPWERVGENALRISLGEHWPFRGHAEQRFALHEDHLELYLAVHAADAPFPAAIGWHPWFRRDIGTGTPAALRFTPGAMYAVDEDMIPTGELVAPNDGPWDDSFRDLRAAPELHWEGAIALTLTSDLDHWVVYDRPAHAICVEPMSAPPNALNSGATLVEPGRPLAGNFRLYWKLLA